MMVSPEYTTLRAMSLNDVSYNAIVEKPSISWVVASCRRITQFLLFKSRSKVSIVAPLKFSRKTRNMEWISEEDKSTRGMTRLVNETGMRLSFGCGERQGLPILYPLNKYMVSVAQQHAQLKLQVAHYHNVRFEKCNREFMHHTQYKSTKRTRQVWRGALWHHIQDVDPRLFIGDRQNGEKDAGIRARVIGENIIASPTMCAQLHNIHSRATQQMIVKVPTFHAGAKVNTEMMWRAT